MQLSKHEEDGSQQRLIGNNEREKQEYKNEFLAGDWEASQCVSGGNRQDKAKDDRQERGAAAVLEIGGQARLIAPKSLIAFEAKMVSEIRRRDRSGLRRCL